jgi:GT2 family glycosyltransferase
MKNLKSLTSIIILNYNAGDLVLDCIKSIFENTPQNIEIILVDNLSTDGSQIKCKKVFPKIKLIQNNENLWFCAGNNVGIREAKGDFLVILNPDTKVTSGWLEELLSAYKKFGDGLYQPKLLTLNNPELFNSAGNFINIFGFGFSRGKNVKDIGQFDDVQEIGNASGACLFTSMEIMKKIDLFDPFLQVYHDDLDLGWRGKHIGIKSYYIPTSIVYHAGSYHYKWSPLKFYLLERNRHYCLLTHYSKKTFYKLLPSLILIEILVFFYFLRKGLFKEKIKAYVNILQNRKQISKKYHDLENKKTIPDSTTIKNFPDEIFITSEIGGNFSSKMFNSILSFFSKISKQIL